MHNQPAASGDWVPKSFKGSFDVELEIIAAVQGYSVCCVRHKQVFRETKVQWVIALQSP